MATFDASRNWCRANGVGAALTQDSQRSAKDLLDELFIVMNSAPVYSGDQLKSIPYDEVSWAGNGAIYTAPTASGPIYYFDDTTIVHQNENDVPVKYTRKRRADCDNVVAIEHIDRDNDYVHRITSQGNITAISQFGPRKGGTLSTADLGVNSPSGAKQLLSISNPATALIIANILAKRSGTGVNEYEFTVPPQFFWLEAMDLIAISDTRLGLNRKPVRITSVKENTDRTLVIKADEFIYGLNHPDSIVVPTATGTLVTPNVDVALVNTPIIFEPTTQMLNNSSQSQIWFIVSDADQNYGGCICYVSLDGGYSYDTVVGNVPPCITGVTVNELPVTADPNTTNVLSVDITNAYGATITSEPQTIADNSSDPCFLAGSTPYNYEIICPTNVTTNATGQYTFTTYMRRGSFNTTIADHLPNTQFGVCAGALAIDLPPAWIGHQLYFKFAAYNQAKTVQNDISVCTPYTYTPTGFANVSSGGLTYASGPSPYVLYQIAGDPTHLQVAGNFIIGPFDTFGIAWSDGRTATYLSRSSVAGGRSLPAISIPDPGTSPITYYISIYDPTRIGEVLPSGNVPLPLYVDTTLSAHAQTPGYVFLGKIIATHAGGKFGSLAGTLGMNQILLTVG